MSEEEVTIKLHNDGKCKYHSYEVTLSYGTVVIYAYGISKLAALAELFIKINETAVRLQKIKRKFSDLLDLENLKDIEVIEVDCLGTPLKVREKDE